MAEKWSLKGTYFESCNCAATCPCIFLSDPTEGNCTVLVAWHVEQGNYGGTKLDGLNVALAVIAPGNMAKTKWKAAAYLDQRASGDQKNALATIFTGQAGGHPAVLASFIGELMGAHDAQIDYSAQGKTRSLSIKGVAEVEIESIAGAGGADVTVSGHPLCISPGFPATVAHSKKLTYKDHGQAWNLSGRNGLHSPFAYEN
jgi:hypothetical protein